VHRDIKPENFLLTHLPTSIVVKLCDFGLSRIKDATHINTIRTGAVCSTGGGVKRLGFNADGVMRSYVQPARFDEESLALLYILRDFFW
jgi:serine/threonine protein kinase